VSCRDASCVDGVQTLAASCDGKGSCPAADTKRCEPFACGTTACKSECSADTDCAPSYRCDTTLKKCITGATCDGNHTLTATDGTQTDCAPFKCDADGSCKKSCASSSDCTDGLLCSEGNCIAAPTADAGDSGGCTSGRRSADGAVTVFGLLLAAVALRRRA
jgi:hypothetical protein